MSENPYANYPAQRRFDDEPIDGPTRMSILAIVALVLAIPACCIPLVGIAAGPLAVIFGVLALLAISRGAGRVAGKGLAATAIFLGVVSTLLWGAVGFGMFSAYGWYRDNPVAKTDAFLKALENQDLATARADLTTAADKDLSDEDLQAFIARLNQSLGAYQHAPTDISQWANAFKDSFKGTQPKGGATGGQMKEMPVALSFANSLAVAFVVPDEARLSAGVFAIEDLYVIIGNGEALTLRYDGPAKRAAMLMTLNPITVAQPDPPQPPDPPAPAEPAQAPPESEPTPQ